MLSWKSERENYEMLCSPNVLNDYLITHMRAYLSDYLCAARRAWYRCQRWNSTKSISTNPKWVSESVTFACLFAHTLISAHHLFTNIKFISKMEWQRWKIKWLGTKANKWTKHTATTEPQQLLHSTQWIKYSYAVSKLANERAKIMWVCACTSWMESEIV